MVALHAYIPEGLRSGNGWPHTSGGEAAAPGELAAPQPPQLERDTPHNTPPCHFWKSRVPPSRILTIFQTPPPPLRQAQSEGVGEEFPQVTRCSWGSAAACSRRPPGSPLLASTHSAVLTQDSPPLKKKPALAHPSAPPPRC